MDRGSGKFCLLWWDKSLNFTGALEGYSVIQGKRNNLASLYPVE
jgi:hypothetical protein